MMTIQSIRGNGERVLIVDDDLDALLFLKLILETQGYRALLANRAETALLLLQHEDIAVDLLLINLVIPETSGGDLARRSRALRPTLSILFMSKFAVVVTRNDG